MNSLVSIGRSRLCGTKASLKSSTIRFCCGCDAVYWMVSFVVMMTRLTLSRFLKSSVASDGPCGSVFGPERMSGTVAPPPDVLAVDSPSACRTGSVPASAGAVAAVSVTVTVLPSVFTSASASCFR